MPLRRLAFLLGLGVTAPALAVAQPSLRGVVRSVGDSGRGIEGAEVTLNRQSTTTDAQGRFRIDGLPARRLPILIRRIGYRPVRTVVEVFAEVPTEVEYFLAPEPHQLPEVNVAVRRTGIYGVVLNPSSEPIPGATIEALGNRGTTQVADSVGRFALPDPRHGTYMLRVSHPDYRDRWVSFNLELGRGRDLSIHLIPGRSEIVSNERSQMLFDLRRRLAFGLRRHFLSGSDLARYGTLSLCDIPRIRAAIGIQQLGKLNGDTPLLPGQICMWRANEVVLVELTGGVTIWEAR